MSLESAFPRLATVGYKATSPKTRRYNCIAWAAGDHRRWWWPSPNGAAYWPNGAPREETLSAFSQAFGTIGFEECESASYEDGFEKVAIYVGSDGLPKHAARQLANRAWSSKLGGYIDIEHTLEGLEGSDYGAVRLFLRRRKSPSLT